MKDDNQSDAGRRHVVITELIGCLLYIINVTAHVSRFRSLVRLSNSTQIIKMSSCFNNTSMGGEHEQLFTSLGNICNFGVQRNVLFSHTAAAL